MGEKRTIHYRRERFLLAKGDAVARPTRASLPRHIRRYRNEPGHPGEERRLRWS